MQNIKEKCKNYLSDDSAVDGSIEKIVLIAVSVAGAMGVGYYIWNKLKAQTTNSDCSELDSPWCVE